MEPKRRNPTVYERSSEVSWTGHEVYLQYSSHKSYESPKTANVCDRFAVRRMIPPEEWRRAFGGRNNMA